MLIMNALKTTVLEVLSCMLSNDSNIRKIAEERKKALEMTEDYPIVLVDIILKSDEAVEERQLATTLLKQYIQNTWKATSDFTPEIHISEELRTILRRELPKGLSVPEKKIQALVAQCVAFMVAKDYPQKWPEILDYTCALLESRYINEVEGVLIFLRELVHFFDHYQAALFAPEVYSLLFNITSKQEVFNTSLRALAVLVFIKFAIAHSLDPQTNHMVGPIMLQMISQIGYILSQPYCENSDFLVKANCVQGLSILCTQRNESIQEAIKQLMPVVWEIMTKCGSEYLLIISGSKGVPYDKTEDPNNPFLFNRLLLNIFELIDTILIHKRGSYMLGSDLSNIMYYLMLYMAPTKSMEQKWTNDEMYSLDESKENLEKSLRVSAKSTLLLISKFYDRPTFIHNLSSTLEKQQVLFTQYSEQPSSYHARLVEGILFGMSCFSAYLQQEKLTSLNMPIFLSQWTSFIDRCNNVPLLARLMHIGGCYSNLLSSSDMLKHLQTCIVHLRNTNQILKYSSIKSLQLHTNKIQQSVHYDLIRSTSIPLIETLFCVITPNLNTNDTALEVLANLIPIDPDYAASVSTRLTELLRQLFEKHFIRHEFISQCNAIVKALSGVPGCDLQAAFVPMITKIQSHGPRNEYEAEMQIAAMWVLDNIVKYAPKPLSPLLLECGFVTACRCILKKGNAGINQSGAEVLRSFLRKAPEQIRVCTDGEGKRLVQYLLETIRFLIDPNNFELSSHPRAGRLCITAMECVGDIVTQDIDFILKCAISGLQRTSDRMTEHSLISIFAYLFINHMEATINFLTSLPGPSGGNALTFLLQKWMGKNILQFERYERNISIIALTRLIHHTLVKVDGRVGFIAAETSLGFKDMGEHEEQNQVSILANMMRMLIEIVDFEVRNRQERDANSSGVYESDSSIDSLDDFEINSDIDPLDEMDPTYTLNIVEYIKVFIKEFYQMQNPHFMNLLKSLNQEEIQFLTANGLLTLS